MGEPQCKAVRQDALSCRVVGHQQLPIDVIPLSTLRICRHCCAFLMTAEVFADQERLEEISVPRKMKV